MSSATKRFGEVQTGYLDLFKLLQPFMQQQVQMAMGFEPGRQLALRNALNLYNPATMQSLDQQFRMQQLGGAADVGKRLAAQLKGQGASTSAQRGAMLQANNNAVRQSNAYSLQNRGLPGLMSLAKQQLGMFDYAMTPAMLNTYGNFGQAVYQRPYQTGQKQGGISLGDIAGAAIGQALGGL